MFLNITFQQKDQAKAEFKAAGIKLFWHPHAKMWECNTDSLPESLQKYDRKNRVRYADDHDVVRVGQDKVGQLIDRIDPPRRTAVRHLPRRSNRSEIMSYAWETARRAANKFGGRASEFFAASLKEAWKLAL